MGCCSQYGCDEFFGERFARRAAERYRKRGLGTTTAWLRDFLLARGGGSALEIGGGVGALVAELVRGGVEQGRLVEVVPAYEPFARQLFEDAGVEVEFRLANLVAEPEAVEPADLVALDRVVCCTPDGPALLRAAAGRTRVALALTYPRERASFRVLARLQNAVFRIAGRRFRVFVHPRAELVRAAEAGGLRLVEERLGVIWATAGFERT